MVGNVGFEPTQAVLPENLISVDYVFTLHFCLGSWYIVSTHLGKVFPLSSAFSNLRRISQHSSQTFQKERSLSS